MTAVAMETAMPATQATRNVLIVGVGGQGVIMISKVLATICQLQGYQVKQSEVHGMAKRGGIVFSHVRFGSEVWSPTIPKGEADVLIALEWAEGLRWLDHLKPDTGTFICDTKRIVPPFACRNRKFGASLAYAQETPAEIVDRVADGYALDASRMAQTLGNERAANTVLLGTLSATLDFPVEDWLRVIEASVPKGSEEINRQAFLDGRSWIENARLDPHHSVEGVAYEKPEVVVPADTAVRLTINEDWCKSCDICVKLCPERCLALNAQNIAYLKDPEACTGCRVCEWLCPDFAISVDRMTVLEAAE
ncbi:MAG: pyruvate ferredoxin oxidoreductase [Hyphomicrobiales bacterium]|nr:MAG: pyruvate ferredoxin oxidoreductase [Hyphomicrobiales bacterium]